MKKKRLPGRLFLLSLFVPVVVLTSMLIKPVTTMVNGEEVTLATIPIDPRDIFYGDYVDLELEINELNASLLTEKLRKQLTNDSFHRDLTVYVSLSKDDNGIYKAVNISEEKPSGSFVQGKMLPYFIDSSENEQSVRINYGIDRFYVEEGTGLELEEQAREGQVVVTVRIHDGYGLVTSVKEVK
ncbi:hypothetical protein GJU40_16910 [Bacillus lacus]|uniref:GDYXXLXY domain-containing protein n=1 Tax=Metabacillus lacus TaxID=1983721 RepID=A0A7X2J1T9_9BACI|nr:GDYXXLXY domain-containing protein [Metabacillus lacus]MRX73825.1 hypothetical protein [Metabacillus lacus]